MRCFICAIFILILVSLLIPSDTSAFPQYKEETGWSCSACHVSKSGGAELTEVGKSFRDKEISVEKAKPAKKVQIKKDYLPLIFGFFHVFAGFLWFGSILYIHIILKPAYAAKGVPRGELILAWTCMTVLVITGIYLLHHQFPSWDLLLTTRTGKLLLAKIAVFVMMLSTATLVTFFLRFRLKEKMGKRLSMVIVGFKGKAYDFSDSPMWKEGLHMKRHRAGEDLTHEMSKAPHGEEVLEKFSIIGDWEKERREAEKSVPKKMFYFLAYFNLVLILLVLLIISLIRWGG